MGEQNNNRKTGNGEKQLAGDSVLPVTRETEMPDGFQHVDRVTLAVLQIEGHVIGPVAFQLPQKLDIERLLKGLNRLGAPSAVNCLHFSIASD